MKLDKSALLAALSPPLDKRLTEQLISEFISLHQRYQLRDWEPATLDGGQFVEVASRLIYHQDSGILNRRKGVCKCLTFIVDENDNNSHTFPDRKSALHLVKSIRAIYKFRSDRGAVHIDPEYTANQIDSQYILHGVHWIFSEILRIFWNSDRSEVSNVIRDIVEFKVPFIAEYDGQLLVQRVECSAEEEVLLLLHHSGIRGMSRTELGNSVMKSASAITNSLTKLRSSNSRQVIKLNGGNYRLTDLGAKRVIDELLVKLDA
ncbi:hypothetical protein HQ587_04910 [bacterium]|nr:hypothetical protein [bacterium]